MNRQECADKRFGAIMELQGADEFKAMAGRLRRFQQNMEKYSVSDVTLPNYLWVAKRGGGISACANAFAEYLYAAKIMEFTGIVKYFEYRLAHIEPGEFFSELTRLNNTISEIAGHHRHYRGLACIDIDDWAQHTTEPYFYKFLDYISSKNDKVLTILYVHTDDRRVVESIESSLSSHIRFETISFRFPNAGELVGFIEEKYFSRRSFYITDDARALLEESIKGIINGKHFNGFITIKQLANDILYSLLTSDIRGYEITADTLSGFSKDSAYVKRIKAFVGANNVMGFGPSRKERVA